MHRRILVIDTSDDNESSIIKSLANTHPDASNNSLAGFMKFHPCEYNGCMYEFTHAGILNRVSADSKSQNSNMNIQKQLNAYRDEINLVLFITKNDHWNKVAYENLRFIDDTLLNKKVPVICIVNDCNDIRIHKYIQIYPNVLIDTVSKHMSTPSIQRIWEVIAANVLPSNMERNHVNHTADNFDSASYTTRSTMRTNDQYDTFSNEWKSSVVPGMFNEKNTSIENIIERCDDYQAHNYEYNCVLLTTGSLNPIHRSHIKNLELVKSYLKHSKPQWNVLAGYLSPTHDDYVRGKLGKATIPGRDRCDLCELAIKDHESETHTRSWLNVSRAECEYRYGFVDFSPTTKALSQYLNSLLLVSRRYLKKPLYVIYVCGLDHFNKCSDVRRLAQEKYIKCAVIYRQNNNEQNISKLDPSSNIIYVPLNNERSDILDISSTEIRRCWKNQPDQLIHLTYPSVIKRLKKMKFHF